MLCPLWTETWTFMQHYKSLDFVHTLKETTHLEQLPFTILVARAFSSSLPEKPEGWSTANSLQMLLKVSSHSQSFLFSSHFSHSPVAAHIWLSFSFSSKHFRFLHLPSTQDGHSCFSSPSGQRDNVLERDSMKGDVSFSSSSSAFCS